MYYEYFGLNHPPFRITPDTRAFYKGGDRGAILRAMMYAVLNGEPIIKLVGEVGSGKTMLCRMLESKLPDYIEIVYISNPNLTPDNILQAIAFELDIPITPHESSSPALMFRSLQQYLLDKHFQNKQVVVFIEEAQSMPLETLEQIRLLSNLETSQHKLLQIVLFGQPELDDNLSHDHVRQIRDRITNSFYLPALTKTDVTDYISLRLHSAGHYGRALFNRNALKILHRASHGLMRRINVLADKSLMAAYAENSRTIMPKHVKSAINDLALENENHTTSVALAATLFTLVVMFGGGLFAYEHFFAKSRTVDVNSLPPTAAGPGKPARMIVKNQPRTSNLPVDSKPEVVHKTQNRSNVIESRRRASIKWLKKVNPNHFSIQVLLTDADSIYGLKRFLHQPGIGDSLHHIYLYRTQVGNNKMIGVLFGSYSSYSEAQKAMHQMPTELKKHRPYIRSLKNLFLPKIGATKSSRQES
jgi:type II secretory pathway predicted ATPase ExeA